MRREHPPPAICCVTCLIAYFRLFYTFIWSSTAAVARRFMHISHWPALTLSGVTRTIYRGVLALYPMQWCICASCKCHDISSPHHLCSLDQAASVAVNACRAADLLESTIPLLVLLLLFVLVLE
jgi:hypothetical protein